MGWIVGLCLGLHDLIWAKASLEWRRKPERELSFDHPHELTLSSPRTWRCVYNTGISKFTAEAPPILTSTPREDNSHRVAQSQHCHFLPSPKERLNPKCIEAPPRLTSQWWEQSPFYLQRISCLVKPLGRPWVEEMGCPQPYGIVESLGREHKAMQKWWSTRIIHSQSSRQRSQNAWKTPSHPNLCLHMSPQSLNPL
jgi:hypothetical protein